MSWHESQPKSECKSLENQTSRLSNQISIDEAVITALDALAKLHGEYALRELNMYEGYGNIAMSIKFNKIELKRLLKLQQKRKEKVMTQQTFKTITFFEMLKQIEEYQTALGGDITQANDHEKLDQARICSLALYQEVAELVDSFPFKPWRDVKDQPMDTENIERETIDIIFFLAQITRCFGITPERLEERFHKVLANNKERLVNGYSKVNTIKTQNEETQK